MALDKVVDSVVLDARMTAVANAIRAKAGTTGSMTIAEMPSKIAAIQTGIIPTGTIDITENGTYDVTDKASAVVNVASGGGGATEPYIEETINNDYFEVTEAKLFGYKCVRKNAFSGCSILNTVYLNNGINTIGKNAFSNCEKLDINSFPATLSQIQEMAFFNCKAISKLTFDCQSIDLRSMSFYSCTSLNTVTLNIAGAKSIASDTFGDCNNLNTINVSWAEGEVKNAPWGATNATINYNYTGG